MNKEILSSAAISEGAWEQTSGLESPFAVSLYGFASGDVAQIYVSDLYDKPLAVAPVDGDGTVQFGSDYTSDIRVLVEPTPRWLRVRKSAAGGTPATTRARVQGAGRQ
jgi:hypothetical protein